MKTTGNTILITGGSAGIGYEIAKLLSESGNKVIITGRDKLRLERANTTLKNADYIVSDMSDENAIEKLARQVEETFPELNMVINNAGRAILYNLGEENIKTREKAEEEMRTNFFAILQLNERLLPQLKRQESAAIVNVSSIVAIVPGKLVTYSASKAALHSYTQSLRLEMQNTPVKVFELMPPLVNTRFSEEIGGHKGIPASEVAKDLLKGLENNEYEIRVGNTELLYRTFLASPEEALKIMNPMHSQLS